MEASFLGAWRRHVRQPCTNSGHVNDSLPNNGAEWIAPVGFDGANFSKSGISDGCVLYSGHRAASRTLGGGPLQCDICAIRMDTAIR